MPVVHMLAALAHGLLGVVHKGGRCRRGIIIRHYQTSLYQTKQIRSASKHMSKSMLRQNCKSYKPQTEKPSKYTLNLNCINA
jgi:hypothetical protein